MTACSQRALDSSHDPGLLSWVDSANRPDADFPLQNLPFGRFTEAAGEAARAGVAIGDELLDLSRAAPLLARHADAPLQAALRPLQAGDLQGFMALGRASWRAVRLALSQALRSDNREREDLARCLVAQSAVRMQLPCRIGDYTDFYSGIHHATAVGRLLRPDQPLMPNYKWLPVGYHGRASSIVASGRPVRRPLGQLRAGAEHPPRLAASRRLDFELELGAYIGPGNPQGESVPIEHADEHLFGVCLLNDWSARDVQAWEYQPLGPFLAKSFATSVSPWIVTLDALEPFRTALVRPGGDAPSLPYLSSPRNSACGAYDLQLEVWLHSEEARRRGRPAALLARSNWARAAYWTLAQLVAHHTCGGCNLQTGDLLGTGTLSGEQPEQAGSLLELSQGGRSPVEIGPGEQRSFLLDGDTVILRAWAQAEGARRIGLGECSGTVLPAAAGGESAA